MAAVLSSATSSTRCRVGNRPAISTDTRTSSQIRVTFSAFRDIDALDRRDDAEGKGRGRCPTRSEHRGHRAYRSTRASERGQAKPSWKILGCDAARQAPSEGRRGRPASRSARRPPRGSGGAASRAARAAAHRVPPAGAVVCIRAASGAGRLHQPPPKVWNSATESDKRAACACTRVSKVCR